MPKRVWSDVKVPSLKKMKMTPSKKYQSAKNKIEGFYRGRFTSGVHGPETKNWDLNVGIGNPVQPTTSAPYVVDLTSGIAEGTNDQQRIGMKINIKSVDIVFYLWQGIGSTLTALTSLTAIPMAASVFLIWDKQPDGSVPAASAIFTLTNSNLTFGLPANSDRFVVLRRFDVALSASGPSTRTERFHVPLDLVSRYPDATGSANTNSLLLCCLTPNQTTNATNYPNLAYNSRVKFTDQ